MPERLGIIGTGLIGTSFALALKARGYSPAITAFDSDPSRLRRAADLAGFDALAESPEQVAAVGGVVVIATFPQAMAEIFSRCGNPAGDAVLTDVGSVKQCVVEAARAALGDDCARFVPGHPIAGNEGSGPQAASASLFESRCAVLTPVPENQPSSVQLIADLWYQAGADRVVRMESAQHDRIFAYNSHLPHALAYALMHSLTCNLSGRDILEYSSGGLQGFTRIAASDPQLWCDILTANADHVIAALDAFSASNERLRAMLKARDADGLRAFFRQVAPVQSRLNKRYGKDTAGEAGK